MLIEFVFDYPSPYAYLASTQLKSIGAPICYEPIAIVDVMKRVNNQPSPACPPKSRYAGIDAARWAQRYGVAFDINRDFFKALAARTFDYRILARGALVAQEAGVFDAYNDAMFAAIWAASEDIVSERGREAFLDTHRIKVAGFWEKAASAELHAELERRNEAAAQRGVFGVPTLFVDGEMFFGNDRLEFVRERVAQSNGGAE